jgi:hypothetical protein
MDLLSIGAWNLMLPRKKTRTTRAHLVEAQSLDSVAVLIQTLIHFSKCKWLLQELIGQSLKI